MTATDSLNSPSAAKAANPHLSPKLKFTGSDRFIRELRRRVDAYFDSTGRRRRDCPQMYFKTATVLAWFFGVYFLLLFAVHAWWLIVPLAVVLGLGLAAIGFNIQHDGGHKAYSDRPWINKIMAMTLDLMGGSSYLWDWKHNSLHHTYPNIEGHDDDINVGFWARLSPHQRHLFFHRAQGIYLWLLYGFLALKWHLVDDFHQIAVGRIGGHKIPRPRGKDLLLFIAGKVSFFSMVFVIPMLLHPWWAVIGTYAIAAFVSGVTLSIVFQLAHCVEEATFPTPQPTSATDGHETMETDWAVHQVRTTVDFARRNRVLSWFLGGLNFQIEHHLMSRICHVHYPDLSRIVEDLCDEFAIPYNAHKGLWPAIASHARWVRQMGKPILAT